MVSSRMTSFIGVLFDGIAYGSLLFLISLGLSVTMGLMNFINLAHGAFAMFGGYLAVWLMMRWGVPFLATLPIAFAVLAAAGALMERVLYRRLYGASALDQVLFTIGITFMSMAAATWFWGSGQQPVTLPAFLRGSNEQISQGDVAAGFQLSGHFLETRVLQPRELTLPDTRGRLLSYLGHK